jgi:DNA-binding GntR family transcriptional regulator
LRRTGSLQDAVRSLAAAVESDDRYAIAEADLEFHNRLVTLMDSERLGALYQGVDAEMRLCIARAAPVNLDPSSLLRDHRAIVVALERGDAAAASKRLERHLESSERLLVGAAQATDLPEARPRSGA